MWGERGSLVQLDENRKREGGPTRATVWLNGGRKGGGENPCVLRFGSTGVGRGRGGSPCVPQFGSTRVGGGKGREPMRATVWLDRGRKWGGENPCMLRFGSKGIGRGRGREPTRAAVRLDEGKKRGGERAHACRGSA